MNEIPGFVVKPETEGINVSKIRPLKEAMLLVVGITGGAVVLFVFVAVFIELTAPMISPRLERRLFGNLADQMDQSSDEDRGELQLRAETILARLLESESELSMPIRIALQRSDEINAFAVPGGLILVTTGLMESVQDDEELAFVIGHELGHFANRDHLRGLGRGVAVAVVSGVLGATGVGSPALRFINHFDLLASRSMDRQQEILADAYGQELLVKTYGDSQGGTLFLSRLEKEAGGGNSWLGYLETHPAAGERIIALSGSGSR